MTKLLQKAMEKLTQLPEGRQNELAEMLIAAADSDLQPYELSPEEKAAVEEGLAQAERGEFATDAQVAALWERFGL